MKSKAALRSPVACDCMQCSVPLLLTHPHCRCLCCQQVLPAWGVWWVIPIETLHAVTFACGWSACAINSSKIAPPGLESTTQVGPGFYYCRALDGWLTGLTACVGLENSSSEPALVALINGCYGVLGMLRQQPRHCICERPPCRHFVAAGALPGSVDRSRQRDWRAAR